MVSVQCIIAGAIKLLLTCGLQGGIGSMAVDPTRSTRSVCKLPDMQDICAYTYVHT